MERPAPDRCRIVLVLPEELRPADAAEALSDAMKGGDIASLIVPVHEMGERAYSDHLKALAAIAQARRHRGHRRARRAHRPRGWVWTACIWAAIWTSSTTCSNASTAA